MLENSCFSRDAVRTTKQLASDSLSSWKASKSELIYKATKLQFPGLRSTVCFMVGELHCTVAIETGVTIAAKYRAAGVSLPSAAAVLTLASGTVFPACRAFAVRS